MTCLIYYICFKTNGSLPRDAKRGPSPSRTSLTPTSPKHMIGGEVFNWSREGVTSESGGCSTSDNLPAPSASPRTRIKTIGIFQFLIFTIWETAF